MRYKSDEPHLYTTPSIPGQEMSRARSGDGSILRSKPKTSCLVYESDCSHI